MKNALATAILTRPAGRNTALARALGQRGWTVIECPALEIESVPVQTTQVSASPCEFDLVVFVSRAAVAGYKRQLDDGFTWPPQVKTACMGPVTAAAIKRAFGEDLTVLHPEGAASRDSEALWPLILAQTMLPRRVLILRGQDGREWLGKKLQALGVEVVVQQTYQREVAAWSEPLCTALRELAQAQARAVWLLTSGHGIEAIIQKLGDLNLLPWFEQCAFALTHERLLPVLAKSLGCQAQRLACRVTSPEDEAIVLCFDQIVE